MICSKCGAPLLAESLFCPNCGQRTHLAENSEKDTLEDELLLALLEEEEEERERQREQNFQKQRELDLINMSQGNTGNVSGTDATMNQSGRQPRMDSDFYRSQSGSGMSPEEQEQRERARQQMREQKERALRQAKEEKRRAEEQKRKRQLEKKRKKNRNTIIILVIIIAILVGGSAYFVYQRNNNNVTYLMNKAQTAYSQKDYQDALTYVEKVLVIEKDNVDALVMEGKIDYFMQDSDDAEGILLHVLELDPVNKDAYTYLLKIYNDRKDYNSIVALKKDVTDPEILALFDQYMVPEPTFDQESGNYTEYFTVKISTSQRGLTVYYTLDGSDPTTESTQYDKSGVKIEEQGDIVLKAIAVDSSGNMSEVATANYHVELEKPETPVANPDGGQFSYQPTVTITSQPGTTVYYTWDGTTPTKDSYEYTGTIYVPEGNNILSVVAIDEFDMSSDVLQCNFIYYAPVPAATDTTTTSTAAGTTDTSAATNSTDAAGQGQ